MTITTEKIHTSQVQKGMYIELPGGWTKHPFLFNRFKVKTDAQVKLIKQFGYDHVLYYPTKSDAKPIACSLDVPEQQDSGMDDESKALLRKLQWEKEERIEELKEYRRAIKRAEKEFKNSLKKIRSVMSLMSSRPLNAIQEATELVNSITDAILGADNLVIHLMSEEKGGEDLYFHSLNVTILSLMVAKAAGMSVSEARTLGLGAMFHDVGKLKIPSKILRKKEKLNNAENKLLQLHTKYGVDLLKITKEFPEWVLPIIVQHHEHLDGSGYPFGLKESKINRLSQVVAVVNHYDNLCHPPDGSLGRTPSSAMSYMYKNSEKKLNMTDVGLLIKLLGIYPPGSVVGLSDGRMGLVMSVNSKDLLHPHVLLYDPDIPRNEAAAIDLSMDEDLSIKKVFKPSQLKCEALEYLSPRTELTYSYYFDDAP
jgi:HD-GYP domain-containing protein (c-di-GMP phosphodiesterase class II)